MKKYIMISMLACFTMLVSCDDDFLDRSPLDKETEPTVFTTYDNFKKYAWGFYTGVGEGNSSIQYPLKAYQNYPQDGDVSDMLYYSPSTHGSWDYSGGFAWVYGEISPSTVSSTPWSFAMIRRTNVLLDNIDGSQLSDKDKEHWRGVGYFFRAHAYFELLKQYGDVPWLEHVVGSTDNAVLYASRDSRELVASNILQNLQYAEEHIYEGGDGANTVNPNVVRALISRFGLWEGTWRKYHGSVDGVDGTKYLEASVKASQSLIDQNLGLMSNYDDVFNSMSLAGEKSILLYRAYKENETSAYGHDLTNRTLSSLFEVTKKMVEHYLCSDGRPISTSTDYEGDVSVYDEFRNRDYRLYYTVCPPYIKGVKEEYITFMKELNTTLMPSNSGSKGKILPVDDAGNRVPIIKAAGIGDYSQTGYFMYKYFNTHNGYLTNSLQGTDGPIFRMGEVLINHAEAMFELGRFNQTVADATVNKLRVRAGVANMTVADIDASFDTYRDPDVDPVLWEIRRERCVELIGSGFRFQDIKRWKKGEYLNDQPVGVKLGDVDIEGSDYTEAEKANLRSIRYNGADNSRYTNCATWVIKPLGWNDKYYLFPIPLSQTVLNPNLLPNNSGWTE